MLRCKSAALFFVGFLLLAGFVAGCGSDDAAAPEQPITIHVMFDLNVSGQALGPDQMNQLMFTNPAGRLYSVTKLRFVVTDVQLHSTGGDHLKLTDLHYFDMDDTTSHEIHYMADGPHAEWNRITFTFGLDEAHNVRDRYIAMTKFHTEMAWPAAMGPDLGYHYMQLEGNYEQSPGGATAGYTTHTGAAQMGMDPAVHHYFQADLPLTPTHVHEGGTGEVTLHFDLNGWYTDHTPADGNDTQYDFTDYPAMIMGNMEAQAKLQTNGPFCFSASMEAVGGH